MNVINSLRGKCFYCEEVDNPRDALQCNIQIHVLVKLLLQQRIQHPFSATQSPGCHADSNCSGEVALTPAGNYSAGSSCFALPVCILQKNLLDSSAGVPAALRLLRGSISSQKGSFSACNADEGSQIA